jgi:hypothetical protein
VTGAEARAAIGRVLRESGAPPLPFERGAGTISKLRTRRVGTSTVTTFEVEYGCRPPKRASKAPSVRPSQSRSTARPKPQAARHPKLVLPERSSSAGVHLGRRSWLIAMNTLGIEEPLIVRWVPRSGMRSSNANPQAQHRWVGGRHEILLPDDVYDADLVACRAVHELFHCADLESYGPDGFRASYDQQSRTNGYRDNEHEVAARAAVRRWAEGGYFCRFVDPYSKLFPVKYSLAS